MDTNSGQADSNTFTLRQLLGENITIVIPDSQRDYCWGTEGAIEKVTTFGMSLLSIYRSGRASSLGLLYGYEYPAGSDHIHIIDGQQRITTLYLLVGMLYRRTPREDLRKMLISDYELIDDLEPRLLYEARSEAMYFMSELVTHFFLDRDGRLSQLEDSSWYCSNYSTDPTVQSFIRAIRRIDGALESVCHEEGWNFDDFADFVTDKLTFFYHDLGERSRAEEMFITINTTGEPLTLPQRVKAQLPATGIDKWEEMELWAWQRRSGKDSKRPATSDRRLTELIIFWEKYSGKDKREIPIDPDDIYRFFLSYRILCECEAALIDMSPDNAAELFIVLTSVKYIERWNLSAADKDLISNFTGLLINIARYQRLSPSGSDTVSAYKMVDRMTSPDLLSLLDIPENIAPKILSDEEKLKLRLISDNIDNRREVTQMIHKGERHPLLYGKLQKLIVWSIDRNTHRVDIHRLSRYIDLVYRIWGKDIDASPELDTLRRALLTLRHNGYPMKKRADSTLSLCWHEYEWQRLMALSPGVIRQLLDRVAELNPEGELCKMIDKFKDKTYPYFFLIASDTFISKCMHRSLLRYSDPFIGYYAEESNGDSAKPATHWLIDGNPVKIDLTRWTAPRPYGSRCLYTDHRWLNVAIDVHYLSGKGYRIELFNRGKMTQKEPFDLSILITKTGRKFFFDKKNRKYSIIAPDSRATLRTLHSLLSGC